jgi:hypothetical protein
VCASNANTHNVCFALQADLTISKCIKDTEQAQGSETQRPCANAGRRAAFEIAICFLITQQLMQQQLLVCAVCTMNVSMTARAGAVD